MNLIEEINKTPLKKTVEVFHTTHTNDKGETVPLGIKVQNRFPTVGLALKQAAENAASKQG